MGSAELELQTVEPEVWDSPEPTTSHEMDYSHRVHVQGKFLFLGDEKFWIKGVTYGTFKPGEDGAQFPERDIVRADFGAMSAAGINCVRTYTPPPAWFLLRLRLMMVDRINSSPSQTA
jgi:hypothetical protein